MSEPTCCSGECMECVDPLNEWDALAMSDLAETLAQIRDNDTNYEVRYPLIFLALAQATAQGIPAGIRIDPAEPEWPVAFIELPGAGQVTWHVSQHGTAWDNHNTEQKLERVNQFIWKWIQIVAPDLIRHDGLTFAEGVVCDHLVDAWNEALELDPPLTDSDRQEFERSIDNAERVLASRIVVRLYPEHWQ